MTNRIVAAALVVALVSPTAWAEPRKILVLKSEGRADTAVRTKVDAALMKLAKTTDAQVSPGDISMTDAAAAVGCTAETPACRDEILSMLAVDELVYANVLPKPGGLEVTAYRVARGGVARDAKSMIMKGSDGEKLDGLAPLFFASTTASLQPPGGELLPPGTPTGPAPTTPPPPAGTGPTPTPPPPTTTAALPPPTSEPAPTTPAAYPPPLVDDPRTSSRRKLVLAGAITGGAFVLVSFLCWGKASDLQGQIDDAPANTTADFDRIRTLESDADGYAGLGNILFIGGLIIGGVSAYYMVKQRRARSAATTARLSPALFDHGAGVALTIGGAR